MTRPLIRRILRYEKVADLQISGILFQVTVIRTRTDRDNIATMNIATTSLSQMGNEPFNRDADDRTNAGRHRGSLTIRSLRFCNESELLETCFRACVQMVAVCLLRESFEVRFGDSLFGHHRQNHKRTGLNPSQKVFVPLSIW
jgi:hypothetical protein